MTRARAPRFTAIGPGEHHLAIARAWPCIDASSVDLAVDEFGDAAEGVNAAFGRRGSVSVTLARAIAELVRACDASYLCVEASSGERDGSARGDEDERRRARRD